MFKKYLSLALVALLANVLMAVPAFARARSSSSSSQVQSVEQIKIKLAKIGVGEKARATVRLKDGTKIKGYVAEVRDTEFVIRDRKTNDARTVSYQDVAKVESNRGHSTARNLGLGIGIGAAAVIGILAIIISQSLD
jgi:hypothetical protein